MKKIILYSTLFISTLFLSINLAYSLPTYIGIEILNMTDDPASSCANADANYGPQGRIRALSSILPNYPIFFNLTNSSGEVWSGNATKDTDYTIGDIIYMPYPINSLNSGEMYTLMFDIDAIRIYLPLEDVSSGEVWSANANDEYWTLGKKGSSPNYEIIMSVSNYGCLPPNIYYHSDSPNDNNFYFSNRTNINSSCMDDSTSYNCDELGAIMLNDYSFNMDKKYNNLYQPTVGNFYLNFVAP